MMLTECITKDHRWITGKQQPCGLSPYISIIKLYPILFLYVVIWLLHHQTTTYGLFLTHTSAQQHIKCTTASCFSSLHRVMTQVTFGITCYIAIADRDHCHHLPQLCKCITVRLSKNQHQLLQSALNAGARLISMPDIIIFLHHYLSSSNG